MDTLIREKKLAPAVFISYSSHSFSNISSSYLEIFFSFSFIFLPPHPLGQLHCFTSEVPIAASGDLQIFELMESARKSPFSKFCRAFLARKHAFLRNLCHKLLGPNNINHCPLFQKP